MFSPQGQGPVHALRGLDQSIRQAVLAVVGHAGFFGELAGKHMSNCEAWRQCCGGCCAAKMGGILRGCCASKEAELRLVHLSA